MDSPLRDMETEHIKIPVSWLRRLKKIARVGEGEQKVPEILAIAKINQIAGYLESIELPDEK